MKHVKLIAAAVFVPVLLVGCAQGRYSGSDYTGAQSRQVERIKSGVILSIAPATIADKPAGLGGVAGAIGGAVAGSSIGAGRGQLLGALGGTVLGALGGSAIDQHMNTHEAVRITIKLDGGETIAVTQALDGEARALRAGDRVNVYTSHGIARVGRN